MRCAPVKGRRHGNTTGDGWRWDDPLRNHFRTSQASIACPIEAMPNNNKASARPAVRSACRRSALRCASQSWQPASEQKQSAVCAAQAQCYDRLQGNASGYFRLKTRAGANATATAQQGPVSRCASTYAPAADAQWLSSDGLWLGYMHPRI